MTGRSFPWVGLLVLSAVTVLAVTTELMPTGLLPQMSSGLHVSQSSIGLLVSCYALTVTITSVPLAVLTRTWPRHRLLALSAAVLGGSAVLAAFAPGYEAVLGSRLIGALAHSMFWATVGAYPGHVVARAQVGRAVGIVLGGATVGFIIGVPLATSVGHALGWRVAFGFVGGLLVVAAGALLAFLPRVHQSDADHAMPGVRPVKVQDRTIRPVLGVCLLALVAMTGHYAFYTFVALYGTDTLGLPSTLISTLFLLIGVGGGVGLIVASTVLSRRTSLAILLSLVVATLSVSAFALIGNNLAASLPAVFIWSVALGVLPVSMQTHLLHVTSAAFRDMGNAIYTATFNAGIGGGALIGAIVLGDVGLGALPWIYVGALVISVLLSITLLRRRDGSPKPEETVATGSLAS